MESEGPASYARMHAYHKGGGVSVSHFGVHVKEMQRHIERWADVNGVDILIYTMEGGWAVPRSRLRF